jgi:AbrB family looped-hinge helix DNA binding protein
MGRTTTLDKAGRIVIPKSVRDEMNLEPGDAVEISSNGDHVTLRPVCSAPRLRKEQGVWVFDSGVPMTAKFVREVLREIREERDRRNSGRPR